MNLHDLKEVRAAVSALKVVSNLAVLESCGKL
jgi:hypothetical protein